MHGQTLLIEAYSHPLRITSRHIIDQGLQLHQERPGALPSNRGNTAGRIHITTLQKYGGRVCDFFHAQIGHGEDAKFVHCTESIFMTTQGAVATSRWTVQHHEAVDHMLQHLGPGDSAFLGDMSHEHNDDVVLFRQARKKRGRFTHLGDRAWRGIEGLHLHDLNRIKNDNLRPLAFNQLRDNLRTGFCGNV